MSLRSIPVRLRRKRAGGTPTASSAARPAPACHAPFTSLYLDQHGSVRACCQNAHHALGNIAEERLRDIWHGTATAELRRALERHDYSLGCEFCEWQVAEGRPDAAFARWYDDFPVESADPEWPVQLELSITNTCNLQCVMCNGDWSSSIRSKREGRAPLPKVYDDAFFEDLREFVPHLRRVKFLGGEPFLASETLRVMELLIEAGSDARCHSTTNGTQWTPRVERILASLPVDVAVSVDGATRETYERIRVGASWDELQRNLDRFQERAATNGTDVSMTFCLMVDNWQEFGDFCRMADDRDVSCDVNTVTHPPHFSLFRLPEDELARVVAGLDDWERRRGSELGRSRSTWELETGRLRRHLEDLREGSPVELLTKRDLNPDPTRNGALFEPQIEHLAGSLSVVEPAALARDEAEVVRSTLGDGPAWLEVDTQQRIVAAGGGTLPGGVGHDDAVGRTLNDIPEMFRPAFGDLVDVEVVSSTDVLLVRGEHEMVIPEWNLRVFESRFADGARIRAVSAPRCSDDGSLLGSRLSMTVPADGR
ncbi:MAG: twitch domain-containing radical SAM protein [Microthrixaceae bacterium]